MTMIATQKPHKPPSRRENGDLMSQVEFHAAYEKTDDDLKAELIGEWFTWHHRYESGTASIICLWGRCCSRTSPIRPAPNGATTRR